MKQRSFNSAAAWALLVAAVLLANAAIMTLELAGSKLIARFLGQSLYTWATLIAAALGGMSLGHYVGGLLADRFRPERVLALALIAAGAAAALLLPLNGLLGQLDLLRAQPWPLRILLHVALAFSAAFVLLGFVNPVAARYGLGFGRATGRTVGAVYALAAGGSIAGTLVTGFILTPHLAISTIYLGSAVLLAGLGMLCLLMPRSAAVAAEAAPALYGAQGAAFRRRFGLYLTAFAVNAAIFVLEMTLARFLTREYGHSLYTWSLLLAFVLAGLTIGNWLGGRIADSDDNEKALSAALSLAAILVAGVVFIHGPLGDSLEDLELPFRLRLTLHTLLLGLLPALMLGVASPIVARLAVLANPAAGAGLGAVYAWGALGAISGAILTGFFFIDWWGPIPTLFGMAAVLAVFAVSRRGMRLLAAPVAAACLVLLALALPTQTMAGLRNAFPGLPKPPSGYIYSDHSQYSWIGVHQEMYDPARRMMVLDSLGHSEVNLAAPTDLLWRFWWIYEGALAEHFPNQQPIRMFMIGGGGYVFPRFIELTRPDSYVEVAEIDPAVTEAAYAAFGLPPDTTIHIHNIDGRNRVDELLRQGDVQFDAVIGDTINQFTVPFQLATLEFGQKVARLLTPEGLYMLNTTDRLEPGRFLGAEVATLQQVFKHVAAISTKPLARNERDTIIILCSQQPLDVDGILGRIRSLHPGFPGEAISDAQIDALLTRNEGRILTDDYAPVDYLTAGLTAPDPAPTFEQADRLAHQQLQAARGLAQKGQTQDALRAYDALTGPLAYHADVWAERAALLAGLGRVEEARESLARAKALAPYRDFAAPAVPQ